MPRLKPLDMKKIEKWQRGIVLANTPGTRSYFKVHSHVYGKKMSSRQFRREHCLFCGFRYDAKKHREDCVRTPVPDDVKKTRILRAASNFIEEMRNDGGEFTAYKFADWILDRYPFYAGSKADAAQYLRYNAKHLGIHKVAQIVTKGTHRQQTTWVVWRAKE